MSKFPSFRKVWYSSVATILRFPLETLVTLVSTICTCLLIQNNFDTRTNEQFIKVIMSCSLCLVWFLSSSLFFGVVQVKVLYRYGLTLCFGLLLFLFVFWFDEAISNVEVQRYFVLNLALHLLVSFAGFLPKKYNQDEFWEFNKQLFLRIVTAGLYSGVLFAGLALAIVAVKELFAIDLDKKFFGYLFVSIAGPFNTLFFLSGIPDIDQNSNVLTLRYPNGLKKFTQYVLLPLITLYLGILLCYEAKILITLSLPVGWVSYLVLVFAIIGILSFLLVYPIATSARNLWLKTFNRWFYYLLIPLLGLLYWAILYRIYSYGVTHERYYVLLLSIWLTIVVGYFLIANNPKIMFIPIAMCLAGLFSIWGPQSADSVSKTSQLDRFEAYVQKMQQQKLSFEEEKELSSIVDFIIENYSLEIMIPYAKEKLANLNTKENKVSTYKVLEALGVTYRYKNETFNTVNKSFYYAYYENNLNAVDNIQGYDFLFLLDNNGELNCEKCITIDATVYSIRSVTKPYGKDLVVNEVSIPLRIFDFVATHSDFRNDNNQKITQIVDHPKYEVLIAYQVVSGTETKEKKVMEDYSIKILLKIK